MTSQQSLFLASQRAQLLRFAAQSQRNEGFGWLNSHGQLDMSRPVELWITCRMTHVAALGALAAETPARGGPTRDELAELSAHGVRSLLGTLHDDMNGGWFAAVRDHDVVTDTKQAYGHAFVILAASSAVAAGVNGARQLFEDACQVSLTHFWDEDEGLSVEEWNADWSQLDTYRGINANMHTVEAYLAAGDISGDPAWYERAARICSRVISWAGENNWRIPEHFDATWTPMLEHHRSEPAHPFRPFGATVGHGLEWSRLLLATAHSFTGSTPHFDEAAVALYDRAVSDGWDADGAEGFVYTTDWDGSPVVHERMHWVLAEALNAAYALHSVTGEARYQRDMDAWWQYARIYLIDEEHGSWIHELDANNQPADTVWPGKPDVYHAYQAVLLPQLPLVPSFAAALRNMGGVSPAP